MELDNTREARNFILRDHHESCPRQTVSGTLAQVLGHKKVKYVVDSLSSDLHRANDKIAMLEAQLQEYVDDAQDSDTE